MLIDTHCHLNDASAFPDTASEILEAKRLGVERMVVVGVRPEEWELTVELCEQHEELFCILGWHPNYTAAFREGEMKRLARLLKHPRVLALGEIGLDYHWDFSPKDAQMAALRDQLRLGEEVGVPLVFHAREAYGDLLTELESRGAARYLFHCFAGSQEDAERAMKLDAYYGVDGPISFKKADDLRKIVRGLPRERLVVETDAPYLTPAPFRGKPNRPAYVRYVAEALARTLGISLEECAALTTANAGRFFGSKLLG